MLGILDGRRKRPKPIRVAVVGIGSIGRGLLRQALLTPGIQCVGLADILVDRARAAARRFGVEEQLFICEDGHELARRDDVDVLIEATSDIHGGARHVKTAIDHGKHVVSMNYEADLMYGVLMADWARRAGVVYSTCDGDQPAVIRRLADEVSLMGFQVVMAGNIKGFHDRYANPTSIAPEADKRGLDHRMCSSYTDGTKLGVEMAVVANSMGMRVGRPGMFGKRMGHVLEIFDHLDFAALWDGSGGLVDYVLGAELRGGVFIVGYTDDRYQQETLAWFPPRMGPGPFYVFYRPYHLGHFESMSTVAEAVINRRAVLSPTCGLRTNVFAFAKRELEPGDRLDGVGGHACYGLIENCDEEGAWEGVPVCLTEGLVVKRKVHKDQRLTIADVKWEVGRDDIRLFQQARALARGDARN